MLEDIHALVGDHLDRWKPRRIASGMRYLSCPVSHNLPPGQEDIPDVRDGLNRRERIVLRVLHETQKERGDRNVPTAMLWGRVCEHFYISPDELSAMLARLGARR
jgi:hypothetical protein